MIVFYAVPIGLWIFLMRRFLKHEKQRKNQLVIAEASNVVLKSPDEPNNRLKECNDEIIEEENISDRRRWVHR